MSGICAVWRRNDAGAAKRSLVSMAQGLTAGSPENVQVKVDGSAGIGLAAGFATQQIYEDPQVMVACDADLSNAADLRQTAGREGTAETLAALYLSGGSGFIAELRGNFSIVLWDKQNRTLLAAVDGFGANRLVYHERDGVFLLASRIDALMQSGEIERDVNPAAIANVLNYSANLAPGTIFSKVRRVLPGTLIQVSEHGVRTETYWDMRYSQSGGRNEAELGREMETLVSNAVKSMCTPSPSGGIGAFLSGGTDSSTVVGLMSRVSERPVHAFSIGFQEQPFNELEYAKLAASKFGAKHHTYLVGADDCFEVLPKMIRSFDEPFGNSSAIPTYFCAKLAAENGVNVLLAGDGGDELFGGNERYATDKIFEYYQRVPRYLRKGLIEPLLASLPLKHGIVGKARRYVARSNMPGLTRLLWYSFLTVHSPKAVFSDDLVEALGDYAVADIPSGYYAQAPATDHLDRVLYTDVKLTLGDSDLPKVSTMCALAGVQARFPFLDRDVAEFSGKLPVDLKVKGREKRYLFKRAFQNLLPAEIIKKQKHGFGIPVALWMKTDARMRELAQDTLRSRRASERGYFRQEFIQDLFQKHEADDTSYYGDCLWTFLVLELWHRQFVDQPVSVSA